MALDRFLIENLKFEEMIRNSLKIVLRNFYRRPAFSIINVLGLAIGLACFVLTMVYVFYELGYDKHIKDKNRIYVVAANLDFGDFQIVNQLATTAMLAETLNATFPEVEAATQVGMGYANYVLHNGNYFRESRIGAVDSSYFKVFSHEFISGDPRTAMTEPRSIVLTESIAKKYFGDKNPYGEVLHIFDNNFKITGVIKDLPKNSTYGMNMFVSLYSWDGWYNDPHWQNNNFLTFFKLRKDATPEQVEAKFPALIKLKIPTIRGEDLESWLAKGNRWDYNLFSFKEIYLDLWGNGIYVLGFGIVAVFLLSIACINYMNLSTAKAVNRAKEVGVRKAIGASKKVLIRQFLSESLLVSSISMILGMGIVEVVLPFLSEFVGKNLSIHYFDNFIVLPLLILLTLFIGLLSGLYPAFVLSAFKAVNVLKGTIGKSGKGLNLRNGLVLVQFTISITLIIGLMIVVKQTNLLYSKKLGYDKENLVVVRSVASIRDKEAFKDALSKIPAIESASFTTRVPGRAVGPTNQWTPEGQAGTLVTLHSVDEDFLKTMRIQLHAGRFFDQDLASDTLAGVINRKAAEFFNWGDTLGKTINNGEHKVHIIGILEDYHYQTLHHEIKPLLVLMVDGAAAYRPNYLAIRIKEGAIPPIDQIEDLWNSYTFERNTQFDYYYFNERYLSYYDQERQTKQLMVILTVLIIFVTALGLFGLASFAIQERMKEIAIRKAIGESVGRIVSKMTWSFTKLILISNVVAWPVAWYVMSDWLNSFATRVSISWWIFILAAVLSYLLAIATVIFQALSAARKNPVDVLRYE